MEPLSEYLSGCRDSRRLPPDLYETGAGDAAEEEDRMDGQPARAGLGQEGQMPWLLGLVWIQLKTDSWIRQEDKSKSF